ncbi:hypothetical protein Rhein_1122 [Rheinheimera sp. A13L]|uniref:hypothetical protein n=1 Tax=Rheinheimera sp. A13L TaxID=506534 RepID=UPI00021253B4|nr:hypothetical protein [Rheinheimera sp. A13L]EGM78781.1 hypothetical protein Rhein_1122 [Rheinheimera sp. A13L]
MSVIIQLLEKMGQSSELRYADAEQLAKLMADTDPALIAAVSAGDQHAIETLLGARTNVVCGIHPADQPEQDEPAEPEQEPEQEKISFLNVG